MVVTKPVAGDVNKEVTITVGYVGIYATAHTITAMLVPPATPGSFGSFSEVDADNGVTIDGGGTEGDINQARHVIYAMPQAGMLAGID